MVNTSEHRRVHVESKFCIAYFFNAVVLLSKILVDCACSGVLGGIEDGGDLNDIGSAKRGEAFFEGLQNFKGRGLIGMFFIREEARDDCVQDSIDDV